MTIVPPGVDGGTLYQPGDVLAIEVIPTDGTANRVMRIDNARSGVPILVTIGHTGAPVDAGSLAFAGGSLYVMSTGAVMQQIDTQNFASVGSPVDVNSSTTDAAPLGGLAFDGLDRWYYTNNDGNTLVTCPAPFTPNTAVGVGPANIGGFATSGLEWYDGALWGAVTSPDGTPRRLLIGTFEHRSGLPTSGNFTQYLDVADATAGGATGFVAFKGCDSIDFNGDGLFPDTQDIADFISVFAGAGCPTGLCGDVDFNNDGLFPDTSDITSLISVFGGGECL